MTNHDASTFSAAPTGVVVCVVAASKAKVQKGKGPRGPVVFRTRFG